MCGIAGILNLRNQAKMLGLNIQSMSEAMKMRGPDSDGVLAAGMQGMPPTTDPNFVKSASARLFFAHRRLSIIDMSDDGWQPLSLSNRRYWIAYNGEIYNFRELRLELSKLGIRFRSECDTEVLLAGYIQWGKDVLSKLHGMFAFAIWDEEMQSLFLARDRLGIKPLYYTQTQEEFVFGSDIKTLIASKLFKPAPNIEGLYHSLGLSVAPRPLTCFENVTALSPGHWLSVDISGKIDSQSYWEISTDKIDKNIDEGIAATCLNDALKKAVTRCQVADTPVGTFLSGGIDSGIVTAMAVSNNEMTEAFTLAFPGHDGDESTEAMATAAKLGLRHHIQNAATDINADILSDMIRCYEEPFPSLAPNYVISKFVHEHGIKVILNGLGADELFAGYGYYSLIEQWEQARKRKWLRPFHAHLWPGKTRERKLMDATRVSDFYADILAPTTLDEEGRRKLFKKNWLPEETSGDLLNRTYMQGREFSDNIQAVNYLDMIHNVGNHHVYRADQFAMRFSLEARFPFLDHELVELAFTLPSKLKYANGQGKRILRHVAKQYVSPESLAAKKKGFGLPVGQWMCGTLATLVDEKLDALGNRPWFNREEIQYRYDLFKAGKLEYRSVWALVSTEMWFETFFPDI